MFDIYMYGETLLMMHQYTRYPPGKDYCDEKAYPRILRLVNNQSIMKKYFSNFNQNMNLDFLR